MNRCVGATSRGATPGPGALDGVGGLVFADAGDGGGVEASAPDNNSSGLSQGPGSLSS